MFYLSSSYAWGSSASAGNSHCMVGYPGETVILRAVSDGDSIINYVGNPSQIPNSSNITFANFTFDANGWEAGVHWRGEGSDGDDPYRVENIRFVNVEVKNYLFNDYTGGTSLIGTAAGPIDNIKFLGCKIHDMDSPSRLDHGIYVAAGGDNIEIGWNTIYNIEKVLSSGSNENAGHGIQIYRGGSSAYGDFNNVSIHDNFIYNCPSRGGITLSDYLRTSYVYNNILVNCGTDGTESGYGIRISIDYSDAHGVHYIYNNVLYNCGEVSPSGSSSSFVFGTDDADHVYLKNNIVRTLANQNYMANGIDPSSYTITNNCWFGSGSAPADDANPNSADPSFVGDSYVGVADFILASTSTCIDDGVNTGGVVASDFLGISRPQNGIFDIGVYEYAVAGLDSPGSFIATTISASIIEWGWSDVADELGYKVYNTTSTELVDTLAAGVTYWLKTGLSANTSNQYYVVAYDAGGESAPTASLRKYTFANAPSSIVFDEVNISSITVSWTGNGGTQYDIVSSTKSDFSATLSTKTLTAITTDFLSLIQETTYWFRVRGYNGDSVKTPYAAIESTETLPSGGPDMPGSYIAIVISISSIEWGWSDVDDETGYKVYNTTAAEVVQTLGAGVTYWVQAGLVANTSHQHYVVAYDGVGESVPTADILKYTFANAPTSLTLDDVGANSVTVSWTGNGGSSFHAIRAVDINFTVGTATKTLSGVTTEFTGLATYTTYWFRVRGRNGDDVVTSYANIVSTRTLSLSTTNYTQDSDCMVAFILEADESPIEDQTVNDLDGTLKGAGEPLFVNAVNSSATYSNAYFNWDGTDDTVYISSAIALSTRDFSVVFWYRQTGEEANNRMVYFDDEFGIMDGDSNDGGNRPAFFVEAGQQQYSCSDYRYTDSWQHVAFVYDNTADTFEFVVDGSSKTLRTTFGWGTTGHTDDRIYIGGRDDSNYTNGDFDEFAIFKRKLTSTEIDGIRTNGLEGLGLEEEQPPVPYFILGK